ncbi:MAG TPA: recombinase family protein [Terriglobia bacterium]|nr:recombinase family protein [Terriglobia bacterium]
MGKVFAYARVSTPRQGEKGVSLPEQKDAIERYAQGRGLEIARWFGERETASETGRNVFNLMLRLLRLGQAQGVIIHKIDRSARNLEDWTDVEKLADAGVEVHFAAENVDLTTATGRLSADIRAVVATHYSRNLREEVIKGLYGRLKQGFYPWAAPLGYLDQGSAKAKIPDPIRAPLIKEAFTRYGTGRFSLPRLAEEMFVRGLRNCRGGKVSVNGLSNVLRNPFYIGLIRIHRNGKTYEGKHRPLVTSAMFQKVQDVLAGKRSDRSERQQFIYSRIARCLVCGYSLIAERQKGHTYYRCHNRAFKKPCPPTCMREDSLDTAILGALAEIDLSDGELQMAQAVIEERRRELGQSVSASRDALQPQLDHIRLRLSKLTDLLVDGTIDKAVFEERRGTLLLEQAGIKEKLAEIERDPVSGLRTIEKIVELAKSPSILYKSASVEKKRELLKTVLSNLVVSEKNVEITLALPFRLIAERQKTPVGRPTGSRTRNHMRKNKSFYIWSSSVPERGRLAVSGNKTHLSLPAPTRYLALHEPDRGRFEGILPYLVRGIPRDDFDGGSAGACIGPLGAIFHSCPPSAGRVGVERRKITSRVR